MASLGDLAAQYEQLVERKKRASTDEKDVSQQMASLEEEILELLGDAGLQNIKLQSGLTLYHAVDKFYGPAEGTTKEELSAELARHPETMDLVEVGYNTNKLRARMKEIEQNGEVLAESLKRMINVFEKDRLKYRSS